MDNLKKIPAVALRGMTILPGMMIHFDVSRDRSIQAVETAMGADQQIFLIAQRKADVEEPELKDLYTTGCVAHIRQVTKLPDNLVRVMVEGKIRGRLAELEIAQDAEDEYLLASVEEEEVVVTESSVEETAMNRSIQELFSKYCSLYPRTGRTLLRHMGEIQNLGQLLDQIIETMPVDYSLKQKVLECWNVKERFEELAGILSNEIAVAKIRSELAEKVKERVEKNQREYILREQLHYIQQELGDDEVSEAKQFENQLSKLKASKEVKEKIAKEIARFRKMGNNSAEAGVQRTYVETLLEMPWDKASKDNSDINRAEEILERDHYGLEKVKERILEFLSVRALTKGGDSPILCLVGPPGTGKTSIARSVAEALNKKYVRICLGGVRDEAEIRGHRRTYIGSMPGRIATGIRQAGVKNPLMLLDEIDKVSSDYKGDTSSALLEVLDGEQNNRFRDHYIEIPLDLSEVLFIATANTTETIPRPLLDRMEIIEITSYTANEKFHIAKEHLLDKELKKNGMDGGKLSISDGALREVIESYTREAGVRGLERRIGEICRKAARELMQHKKSAVKVTGRNLENYLGKKKYNPIRANKTDEIGIVRGLAWTSVGGDTLQIEVNIMPGKGEVKLTGQLGDVMKESAMAGISYIRSVAPEYGIAEDVFKNSDFHIHIPEGAVPKDGPSAGITMATALLSALTHRPVRADVAMTGEITLRGRVLAIGGLKEKTLAAKMAGIKTVLVPAKNRPDVEEIPGEIKSGLEIIFVENMRDVIAHAFAAEA
ncbi:MAG: endopeptidase La [Lachnospiraceae bacterium]|nr:endopeptidase La [Lachnospiraceae bacterium]